MVRICTANVSNRVRYVKGCRDGKQMCKNGVSGAVKRGNNLEKNVRINAKRWSYERLIVKTKGSKKFLLTKRDIKRRYSCE